MKFNTLVLTIVLASASAFAGIIVDKAPDQGAYWHPLGDTGGTYVYTDSFVFNGAAGTQATTLGVYMQRYNGTGNGTSFFFELFADNGNAPNPGAVLGQTGLMQVSNTSLQLITNTLISAVTLTPGTRYWVAASVVGQSPVGPYQVGGHTQGADGGTFWYSNDPAGLNFDGKNLQPEMAIYVGGNAAGVPEPATCALIATGLAALAVRRRRVG